MERCEDESVERTYMYVYICVRIREREFYLERRRRRRSRICASDEMFFALRRVKFYIEWKGKYGFLFVIRAARESICLCVCMHVWRIPC